MTNGTASRQADTMMMPFGRSVCATATMPPMVTNRMTKQAAIVCPTSSEMSPSVMTLRM